MFFHQHLSGKSAILYRPCQVSGIIVTRIQYRTSCLWTSQPVAPTAYQALAYHQRRRKHRNTGFESTALYQAREGTHPPHVFLEIHSIVNVFFIEAAFLWSTVLSFNERKSYIFNTLTFQYVSNILKTFERIYSKEMFIALLSNKKIKLRFSLQPLIV